jgi:hypothetical protein
MDLPILGVNCRYYIFDLIVGNGKSTIGSAFGNIDCSAMVLRVGCPKGLEACDPMIGDL